MKFITNYIFGLLTIISLCLSEKAFAQSNCVGVGINATDPATLEYDNMITSNYQTVVKQGEGDFWVWGENMLNTGLADVANPQQINKTNYPALQGNVLKVAIGGAGQGVALTTTGLYAWGTEGSVINSAITTSATFQALTIGGNTNGLPTGVAPSDVKMLFATYQNLAITTNSGDVYVLSQIGANMGVGATVATNVWNKVKTDASTDLTNVVAVRGSNRALIALKSDGTVWTWGAISYLGDGTAAAARTYASQMTLPVGITPKMIGATGTSALISYYVLATNGALYGLGRNSSRQLGDFTITDRLTWVQVQKSATAGDYFTDITYISPQEHYTTNLSINFLTTSGQLYAMGSNGASDALGGTTTTINPERPSGILATDVISLVETGSISSSVIKQGLYGYVGSKISGSMGDGTTTGTINSYNFNTPPIRVCGVACTTANNPTVSKNSIRNYCPSTAVNLQGLVTSSIPSGMGLRFYRGANDPILSDSIKHSNAFTFTPGLKENVYAYYIDLTTNCVSSMPAMIEVDIKSCGCSDAGINTTNPATIDYDVMTSSFHESAVKQPDGSFLVWGQDIGSDGTSNVLSPQKLDSINYPNLRGKVLKVGLAQVFQGMALSTNGLYIWGGRGQLVDTLLTPSTTFQSFRVGLTNKYGLPYGVYPSDVKMMFTTTGNVALTTYAGDVYVLSKTGAAMGIGSSTANDFWHQVQTNTTTYLTDVIATRGNGPNLMALKADGTVWTWGTTTYLGNSTAVAARTYATQMTLPAGITPKMIGMTAGPTYYVLATNGALYAMGENASKQLGDFTTTDRTAWVRVQKTAIAGDYFTDVAYISPQEHYGTGGAINFITQSGKLYAIGYNSTDMLGGSAGTINPEVPAGILPTDLITLVETGGHTSAVVKEGSTRYGYIGHRTSGSMGDGTATDATVPSYNFTTTPEVSVCGASCLATSIPTLSATSVNNACPLNTVNLRNLVNSTPPAAGVELRFFLVSTNPVLDDSLTNTQAYNQSNTVYAYYYDTVNDCISDASPAITVTIAACCTLPTATASATNATCSGPTANSDGKITITSFTTGQRYQYSSGATFSSGSATPASITAIPAGGVIVSNLANTASSYTVRIYDASDNTCYVDRVVSTTVTNCNCPTVAAPAIADASRCGAGTVVANITTVCATGTTLKLYSDATLVTDVTSSFTVGASSITSPSISTTTTYYGACIDNTFTSCKSSGDSFILTVTTPPTATASGTNATCSGPTANSDGKLTIASFTAGQRYQYSTGGTFVSGSATPVSITAIPVGGVIVSNLANTASSYTIRIYDATDDNCYVDKVVAITSTNCNCPTVSAPVISDVSRCGVGTVVANITTVCASGTTLKLYSDATLVTDVTSSFTVGASSITSPSISTTTTYYGACIDNTFTSCKSSGDSFVLTITQLASSSQPTTIAGTCSGATLNNDASIMLSNVVGDKVGISSAGASGYDGQNYATASTISGTTHTISGLTHGASYWIRIYNTASCVSDATLITASRTCCPIPNCSTATVIKN